MRSLIWHEHLERVCAARPAVVQVGLLLCGEHSLVEEPTVEVGRHAVRARILAAKRERHVRLDGRNRGAGARLTRAVVDLELACLGRGRVLSDPEVPSVQTGNCLPRRLALGYAVPSVATGDTEANIARALS